MSNKEKIKKLEGDLEAATAMIKHISSLIQPATQALRYIAAEEKDRSEIVLLKSVGIGSPESNKQPAKEVALECLQVMYDLQQDFTLPKTSAVKAVDAPEEVRLVDGDVIEFNTTFDILYHECCGCGLLHEVELSWSDVNGEPVLETRWTQKAEMPAKDDVLSAGNKVVELSK